MIDSQGAPLGTRSARGLGSGAYAVVFGLYAAGVLLWLTLGLLPTIAALLAPMHDALEWVSRGEGLLGDAAARILIAEPPAPGVRFVVEYAFSFLNLALGVLLAVRCPHDTVPRLLSVAFLGTAATFNSASHAVFHLLGSLTFISELHFAFHVVSGVAYLWAVVLFPDGRLPGVALLERRHTLALVGAISTVLIAWGCYQSSFFTHTPFFVTFFGVLVPIVGFLAQSLRLRAAGMSRVPIQQSRLLRGALAPAFAVSLVWLVAAVLARAGFGSNLVLTTGVAAGQAFPAVFAVVPVVLFVAILRYRLWALDLVLSRTVLIVLLGAFVTAVYVVTLALTGVLFRDRTWSVVLAMTVVGLAIEPVRMWGGRLANRLVYGQELTPQQALRLLVERLGGAAGRSDLAELTRVVVGGTRCSSAEVWLVVEEPRGGKALLLAAATPVREGGVRAIPLPASAEVSGDFLPGTRCLPVRHDGRLLAVVAVRVPAGTHLPPREDRLLNDLAGHAGMLVANAHLTEELATHLRLVGEYAEELRSSRRRLVAAQDEERRKLERDIHDGAQQELVALLIHVRALERAGAAPDRAALEELRRSVRSAAETARALCQDGPALLRQHGLAVALEQALGPARWSGLHVYVQCEVPERLPDPVESALFFCCMEAVQNAVKHARARQIVVRITLRGDRAQLEVTDDGLGFDPSAAGRRSGLRHFSERVAVLAGSAEVESSPGGGTRVCCRIPVASEPGTAVARSLAVLG